MVGYFPIRKNNITQDTVIKMNFLDILLETILKIIDENQWVANPNFSCNFQQIA